MTYLPLLTELSLELTFKKREWHTFLHQDCQRPFWPIAHTGNPSAQWDSLDG